MAYLIAVMTPWRVLRPAPKPKSQGRPMDTDAPVACHFVNACQISGVFRTCFHCNLKDQTWISWMCYDRALLPSIICLGRLRIASKYIFNLWQLRQWVDSLAQWLEHWIFIREDPSSIPMKGGIFFQLCFIPLLRLSCRKMGARPGLDFIRRKWLHVIINDDFLEKGECYNRALLPSIICLGRLRIASKYIFNLWQLRQWVDSLAQRLEHWIFIQEDPGSIPMKGIIFFQLCFIPLLRLSCRQILGDLDWVI